MDYKNAGVDIEAGYKSVELMKEHVKKTMRPEVLGGLGGFSGAFSLAKIKEMEEPVLLSGTDGCGTKVKLAMILDKHDTIGIDAVAMCVNDIERIGDQASDIAEIVTYLSGACGHNTHIDQMAQATIKMVTDSLDAFVRRDLTLAWSVIEYDDVVDRLFDECKSDLIAEIAQNPEDGERVLDVLMIAKYLERIGDHATNIAEWVEFSITGSHKSAMHGAEAAAR